jgi:hypothetical protein
MLHHPELDLDGVARVTGRTFRWEGVYSQDMNTRKTLRTELNVFEHFRPELSHRARTLRNVFLANIDPVLQRRVLDQLERPRLILADTMNFWIQNKREELLRTLRQVRMLLINEEEARELTGEPLTHQAARAILDLGPETVVIKQGEHGAFLQNADTYFACPAFPVDSLVDPTGAGDTFAGGFFGALARMGRLTEANMRRAVVYGAVMASFTVEGFGVTGLLRVEREEILRRADAIMQMTRFSLDDTSRLLR